MACWVCNLGLIYKQPQRRLSGYGYVVRERRSRLAERVKSRRSMRVRLLGKHTRTGPLRRRGPNGNRAVGKKTTLCRRVATEGGMGCPAIRDDGRPAAA